MEIALAKQPTGPLECAGCHDAAKRSTYKVVADVPRLEAGQTDAMLLVAPAPKSAAKDAPRSVVAFDHKAHEAKVNRCSACHHDARSQGVPACSQCHTPGGKED
ncbi:MAG TPA: cytochrome C, partial [Desulfomicrobiaceae bacterium]|nr:cytochrome C [Desulfomicrobiaceae bacterium]